MKIKKALKQIIYFVFVFTAIFFALFILQAKKIDENQTQDIKLSAIKTGFSFLSNKLNTQNKNEGKNITILLLGVPGKGNPAPYLTDAILLANINQKKNKLSLLSIPRDLLVKNQNKQIKINALFAINKKDPTLIRKKVEEITGRKIDYYLVFDMSAVKKIVKLFGGLNVYVPHNIYDPKFPTPNYGTEVFKLQKGWRYLDAEAVEKFIRTRNSKEGDIDRNKQQQAIIEALRKKLFGTNFKIDLETAIKIFEIISNNIQTDLTEDDIVKLYSAVKTIGYENVRSQTLSFEKDGILKPKIVYFGSQKAYVLVPKAGDFNYSEIKLLTKKLFDE